MHNTQIYTDLDTSCCHVTTSEIQSWSFLQINWNLEINYINWDLLGLQNPYYVHNIIIIVIIITD